PPKVGSPGPTMKLITLSGKPQSSRLDGASSSARSVQGFGVPIHGGPESPAGSMHGIADCTSPKLAPVQTNSGANRNPLYIIGRHAIHESSISAKARP